MVRTKKPVKLGCLSRSLDKFLDMSDEERKKKYGNNVHKYWDRIVQSLKESFTDHERAYLKLPDKYAKKINFTQEYNAMMSLVIEKKWIEEAPKKNKEGLLEMSIVLRTELDKLALNNDA